MKKISQPDILHLWFWNLKMTTYNIIYSYIQYSILAIHAQTINQGIKVQKNDRNKKKIQQTMNLTRQEPGICTHNID